MRVVRDLDRLGDALASARREALGRVRRRAAHPRALPRGAAPRRGPGPVRRARAGRPPRRARLLAPAPSPEGPRGDAVAGRRRRPARRARPSGACPRRLGRLRQRRDVRVPARRSRLVLLPRDEHPAPGRAPGDRARDRPRSRRRPDRGSPPASRCPSTRPRSTRRCGTADTPSRSGSTPRTRTPGSCRRPARIEAIRWPDTADGRLRVDAGIEVGTEVGDRFDPMLAKIIAGGRDRAEALARLAAALDGTVGPRPDDEPALPALARPPARRSGRRRPHRHPRPDLAARRCRRRRRPAGRCLGDRRGPPGRVGARWAGQRPSGFRWAGHRPVGRRLAAERAGAPAPRRRRLRRAIRRAQ